MLILNPAGNDDAEYVNVFNPPLPLTGLNGVKDINRVIDGILAGTAIAITSGAFIVNLNLN